MRFERPLGLGSIGNCLRRLSAHQKGEVDLTLHEQATQVLFREGHMHETVVHTDLWQLGWSVDGDQQEVELSVNEGEGVMVGHIDGICWRREDHEDYKQTTLSEQEYGTAIIDAYHDLPDSDLPFLLEIKSMNDHRFAEWKREGFKTFPDYAMQVLGYGMAMQELCVKHPELLPNSTREKLEATGTLPCVTPDPLVRDWIIPLLYIVKNRSTGEVIVETYSTPESLAVDMDVGTVTSRIRLLAAAAKNNAILDAENYNPEGYRCKYCPAAHLCSTVEVLPQDVTGAGAELALTGPDVIAMAEQYREWKPRAKEAKEKLEEARTFLKAAAEAVGGQALCNGLVIAVGQRTSTTFDMKAVLTEQQIREITRKSSSSSVRISDKREAD